MQQQESHSLSDDLKQSLSNLASLNNRKNSKVALGARQVRLLLHLLPVTQHYPSLPLQVLIAAHLPSYELRYNQVESIFLSSIAGASFEAERLEHLIKSGTSIFDIIPSFFYHKNKLVKVAALEVGCV